MTSPAREWSLEPTRRILESLGNPERHFPSIHVGGTNGKGSVCALLDAVLTAARYRVGRYTSPHLVDIRERMLVAGRPIPERAFATWSEAIRPEVEKTDASFFEATTAVAFADFAARGVDIAVVEVGLGGRLDSTNVIDPAVSVVTHIARDHTEYLGQTLQEIAREKAGIAKRGKAFVIGEPTAELAQILAEEGSRLGADVRRVPAELRYDGALGLTGRHQARNAAVAEAALEALPGEFRVSRDALERGFAAATLPGRFDRRGKWIFDVAHNLEGAEALGQALAQAAPPRPLHALVGILADKDWAGMLELWRGLVDGLWLTIPPSAPAERRWDLDLVGQSGRRSAGPPVCVEPDFDRALAGVQKGARTVLVAGSFHTVGDALARLPGFAPLG